MEKDEKKINIEDKSEIYVEEIENSIVYDLSKTSSNGKDSFLERFLKVLKGENKSNGL